MTEEERYPIDEALVSMISDLRQMQTQCQGALTLFIRQHKLEGNWQIAPSGKELIRMEAQNVSRND